MNQSSDTGKLQTIQFERELTITCVSVALGPLIVEHLLTLD